MKKTNHLPSASLVSDKIISQTFLALDKDLKKLESLAFSFEADTGITEPRRVELERLKATLKNSRLALDSKRKTVKFPYLQACRDIDATAKLISNRIGDMEKHLKLVSDSLTRQIPVSNTAANFIDLGTSLEFKDFLLSECEENGNASTFDFIYQSWKKFYDLKANVKL